MYTYGIDRVDSDRSTVLIRWENSEKGRQIMVDILCLRPKRLGMRDLVDMWEDSVPGSEEERSLWDHLESIKGKGVVRDGDQLLLGI